MTELTIDVDLAHPRSRVWRALTDARLLSEWFMPTDLVAVPGHTYRAFPPPGLLGLASAFDTDVVEAVEAERLAMHWRDDHTHTEMTWTLSDADGGCRLTVLQTGFFGVDGTRRRRELRRTYQLLFGERLPTALDRLASGEVDLGGVVATLHTAIPRRRDPVAPAPVAPPAPNRRMRLLSLIGAAVLVVLASSAVAVMIGNSGGGEPVAVGEEQYGLGVGVQPAGSQPAATATPSVTMTPGTTVGSTSPSPSGLPASGSPVPEVTVTTGPNAQLTAGYKTIALLGLGGFDTEVTVRNPGTLAADGWTVVLTMPSDRTVENRTTAKVQSTQAGAQVTIVPVAAARSLAPGASVTFSIRFPALLAVGQSAKGCTINGFACAAG
ncbi:SRPBCC domain-containing protein [Catellatospora tritici]|uniref:SRPBCC domain-containing protein n=1 Tax=Catellatospora tritici TaxID=2851566 RepID=UPI001C2D59BC|nr:SRPBCC domain-containing protein [Catellatospora tritici]MBV1849451.1 SRPBCC domain-containing protein [Catellatospora tritici]MBV1854023.1 SRPBCC domain-containing protein [Catellatospora tritici]